MNHWTFYPVFIATLISIVGLGRLAAREHNRDMPRNLSQLAAAEQRLLVRFRNILVICGVLFAITVFGFIVPRMTDIWVAIFGGLMIGGELLAGLIPARGKTVLLHNGLAQVMALGMFGLALLFWINLEGVYAWLELALLGSMVVMGILTLLDRRRYIIYELGYIYLSHTSILVAAIALGRHWQ